MKLSTTVRRGPQPGYQCSVKGQFNLSGVALTTPTVWLAAQYFIHADRGSDTVLYSDWQSTPFVEAPTRFSDFTKRKIWSGKI